MSTSETEALALRTVEALNSHDVDAFREMSGETEEEWAPLGPRHAGLQPAFPDYRISVERIVAREDDFAIFYRVTATHVAEFPAAELEGIPATGRQLSWDESVYSVVRDGKVVDGGLVIAGVERLQQLGVLPATKRDFPE